MPDQPPVLRWVGAPFDHRIDGAALVLAEDGLPGLAIFDVEEHPLAQGAKEVTWLEERLYGIAVGLVACVLPPKEHAAVDVPRDAVPVFDQVRLIVQLRLSQELWRLHLVTPELGHGFGKSVAVLRVLVLDDGDRDAVDDEHDVRTVPLRPGRRLDLPLPRDVQ